MSLNWDASKIEGFNDTEYGQYVVDGVDMWHPVTSCIVHRMMHTGLGWELEESNAAEFYARCKLADSLAGELLFIDGKKSELTPKMINDHIGLRVNVSPETRKSFINRFTEVSFHKWLHDYTVKRVQDVQQN